MKLTISPSPLAEQKKDAIIIFFQGADPLLPSGHAALKKLVAAYVKNAAFKGQAGQTAVFPLPEKMKANRLIVAGLGEDKDFYNGLLEQAAAAAVKAGRAAGMKSFAMASTIKLTGVSEADYQLLAGRGAAWGTYEFSTFKSDHKKKPAASLVFAGAVKDRTAVKNAEAQGTALLDTANVANLPGNEAPPAKIADWAKAMAKANGLSCQVLGKAELTKKGCGGILSVAQGSAQDAKMIILKHAGTDKTAKPIVLVGKTVTFDSGGISLKPGKGMGWMRYDKCGGMAVLTAMQMIARMNVKTPVVGILGAAENMPGSRATRPGDIIKAYNGKTIEVLNTDAEGRLVLADALGLAAEMKPAAIVDLATLTGAVIVALGSAASAVLGNDQKLINQLVSSGTEAGERLWQLPLYKDYSDEMKSDFADLSNLGKSGGAGTATAAAFLQEFVPDGIPWAHIDIAGTAWVESAKPYQDAGATLFGSRLLAQWISAQG
ncbi:leucyl aminopeptidase family protein [Pontiella sulfatireligans]|uniref:Probable cytosol aminopeptidase n=1 Tax=Pontiella sulfatireligans TaxID=2750658 RepID=A0A6C2UUM8_9BACT|nr:leucyl aminopeptidase [Pontiella sulfatireligans]VGO23071.1 Cytosol aminopeptidase [Pontiella sulfatireligans]